MKNQFIVIAFLMTVGCNTSVEQGVSIDDQVTALSQDPRFLEYTLSSLSQAQVFDKRNPDWEVIKSKLVLSGISDLCSEEVPNEFSSIEGMLEFRTFYCKQQELFRVLKSDYPSIMSNQENMRLAFNKLKTSPKYVAEFERITGLSLNLE